MVWCDPAVSHSIFGDGQGMQIESNGNYAWVISTTTPPVMHKIRLSDGVEVDSWTLESDHDRYGICLEDGGTHWRIILKWYKYVRRYDYAGNYLSQLGLADNWNGNEGLAWYNGYLYLLYVESASNLWVKKIDPTTGITEASYTLTSHTATPKGITRAGDYWFIHGWSERYIIKYDDDFNEIEICQPTDHIYNYGGISYDGTYLWYVDQTNDEIHRTGLLPVSGVVKKRNWHRVGLNMRRF